MAKAPSSVCFWLLAVLVLFKIDGSQGIEPVQYYELQKGDFIVKVTNYGATILSVFLPDKNGKWEDCVLAYGSVRDYLYHVAHNDTTYFGNVVGRVANRIGGAQFHLNGVHYKLVANDGNNTLHGGHRGFGAVVWTVQEYVRKSYITLTYDSFDGEQGFPGNVSVKVTYKIKGKHHLAVHMEAKVLNKATPVNMAQHTYWNLDGHANGTILSHKIKLFASHITPVDSHLIPTGAIVPVEGTPYDFRKRREIRSKIDELASGYDINYVLDEAGHKHLTKVAELHGHVSGRKMELWSNQPGVQFYTGNMLHNVKGKDGVIYPQYGGLALETQGFPDSVNHPNFPSQIINPGEKYEHVMVYKFSTQEN